MSSNLTWATTPLLKKKSDTTTNTKCPNHITLICLLLLSLIPLSTLILFLNKSLIYAHQVYNFGHLNLYYCIIVLNHHLTIIYVCAINFFIWSKLFMLSNINYLVGFLRTKYVVLSRIEQFFLCSDLIDSKLWTCQIKLISSFRRIRLNWKILKP